MKEKQFSAFLKALWNNHFQKQKVKKKTFCTEKIPV